MFERDNFQTTPTYITARRYFYTYHLENDHGFWTIRTSFIFENAVATCWRAKTKHFCPEDSVLYCKKSRMEIFADCLK